MNQYRYLVLWYQPRLDEDTAEPFAVVVEKKDLDERCIFCIGKHLRGDEATIGGTLVINFKDVLVERLGSAGELCSDRDWVLDKLRAEFSGNIYALGPEQKPSAQSLPMVAYELFALHVDLPAEALVRLRRDIVPLHAREQYAIGPLALPC